MSFRPVPRRKSLLSALAASTTLAFPLAANAVPGTDSYTWTDPPGFDNNWLDAASWSGPGGFPNSATAEAIFTGDNSTLTTFTSESGATTVQVNRVVLSDYVHTLQGNSGDRLLFAGTLPTIHVETDSELFLIGPDTFYAVDGTLNKTGDGTVELQTVLSGAVLVSDGTLDLGKGAGVTGNVDLESDGRVVVQAPSQSGAPADSAISIGSLSGVGEVTLNGNLLTNGDNTSTIFSGTITGGPGSLIKIGTGTLTLSGDASGFAGGFSVNEGTLAIGSDNALGENTVGLSGSAALELLDGVTIDNGTAVGTGTQLVVTSGTARHEGEIFSAVAVIDVPLEGPATTQLISEEPPSQRISKAGDGELILTGTLTNVDLDVSEGRLIFNGMTEGLINVESGALLGGEGEIGSLVIGSGAALAPGNSIGTVTVLGDTTFAAGSTYLVEVAADGRSDRTDVGGTAAVDGTVTPISVDPAADYSATTRYTIVTAVGGVTGEFDAVVEDAALVEYELVQDDNNVYLVRSVITEEEEPEEPEDGEEEEPGDPEPPTEPDDGDEEEPGAPDDGDEEEPGAPPPVPEDGEDVPGDDGEEPLPNFALPASGANAEGLALVLSEFDFSGDDVVILNSLLGLNEADLNRAYRQLGGQIHAEVGRASAELSQHFNATMMNAAGSVTGASAGTAIGSLPASLTWAEIYGSDLDVDGDGNASGFSRGTFGVASGTEAQLDLFGQASTVGVALGYSEAHVALTDVAETADIESFHLGVYTESGAAPMEPGLAVSTALSFGRHAIETERHIVFGSVDRTATDAYDARSVNVAMETSYNVAVDNPYGILMVSPFAGLQYSRVDVDDVDESGAGSLNLSGSDNGADWATMSLGVAVAGELALGGAGLKTVSTLAYERVLGDEVGSATLSLDGSPASFEVQGVDQSRDRIRTGTRATYSFGNGADMSVALDGIFGEDREELNVSTSFTFTF